MPSIPRQTPTRTAASITRTQKAVKASGKAGGAAHPNIVTTGHSPTLAGKRGPGPSVVKGGGSTGAAIPKSGMRHPGGTPPISRTPRPQKAPPAPIDVGQGAANMVKGGAALGAKHVQNNMAVPIFLGLTFVVVAIAKVKGAASNLDIPKALFGGFILTFVLLGVNAWNSGIATGFAALIFVGALLELGAPFFNSLNFSGKTDIPATSDYSSGNFQNTPSTGAGVHDNVGHGTQLA